jgi:glycosyltransferase involved in cell wall biosynthesis
VRFTGSIPQESLPAWYSAADVLVLASTREGWPNVLLEAMACGTPVVASHVGGTPEIVTSPAVGHLVAPDDQAGFDAAIAHRLQHPADRAAVRAHAGGMSWAQTSQGQLALFREAAEGR